MNKLHAVPLAFVCWLLFASASANSVTLEPSSTSPSLMITSRPPPGGTDYTAYAAYTQYVGHSCQGHPFCSCYPGYHGILICYERFQNFQLTASGGTQPYIWKWVATTRLGLPPGLQMSPAGLIVGSPTRAGTYGVAVTVTDQSVPTAHVTATYTITIKPPPPPQLHTVSTLAAAINVPFRFAFLATGGQTPVTWSEAGTLPTRLSLNSQGVLSGTPLVTGSFPVTIKVQDSAGQSSTPQALTVVITPHGFGMTGGMKTPRSFHTATLLEDGTVLIAGGTNNPGEVGAAVSNSELYVPANAAFSPSGALATARYSHTATRLGIGQVLVAGGYSSIDGSNGIAMQSAELYEPSRKTFTALGNMVSARGSHTATLLANGKVLLTGGAGQVDLNFIQATAELFDPATRSFSMTGVMSIPRAGHTATLLGTGKVLVAGGAMSDGLTTASAELYDPATGTFTLTGAMNEPRLAHTATLLPNGKVLVIGGMSATTYPLEMLRSAEIYDPKSGLFTTTGSMGTERASHTAALLENGSVLVAGGLDPNGDPIPSAEVYAPGTGEFSLTGGLQNPRASHAATVLRTGAVLVTGGNNAISTAEVYR